ncbi:MAG: right-handed parallel beta-helix repeat-containing protein [Candidatus Bathyarchaeota archaeon]|nr:right-handed parallel beta-helix repeat-containing protein [Candidatus Bathyarchaeota archaeon]MDW8040400.1 right-handed parallel beta-helix repeat-containing protein [Nitrososphaerota archaeon]
MRKIVSVIALLVLLLAVVGAVSVTINPVNCESGTSVKGIIGTNTTWTLANSPYVLKGPVLVNRSAVLTIEPGVIVNFTRYFIQVDGVLNARGNETHPIRFISVEEATSEEGSIIFTASSIPWDEAANFGSIIDHAIITAPRNDQWQYSHIYVAIRIQGSSPRISNSIVSNSWGEGIRIDSGSPFIVNNTIINNRVAGIAIFGGAPLIVDNVIANGDMGVSIMGGSPKIYRNKIVMNGAEYKEGSGGIGVGSNSQATIANNTISGNLNGVTLSYSPSLIIHNNIMGNKYYDARLWGSHDVNVTYNWWGTTDTSLIDERIWDFYDDFRLGKVIYTPFLSAPSPGAPPWDGTQPTVDNIPPTIESIARTPTGDVQPNQEVKVSAKVTDADSGVKKVVLLYSLDGGASWINVAMNFNITSGFWEGTIPGQPAGTQIQYKVVAYDNAGNSAATSVTTLQIQSNQNPPPSTPLTPLIVILIILVVIASILAVSITILKLKKRKSKNY